MSNEQKNARAVQVKTAGKFPSVEDQWEPGQSGNPSGKKRFAGWAVADWYNHLQDWTQPDLEKVANDPLQPSAKASAARQWLEARSPALSKSGVPNAGNALDRICDRTAGRPSQSLEMAVGDPWKDDAKIAIDPATIAYMQFLSANGRALRAKQLEADNAKSLPPPDSA